ncbi:MAG: sulfatase [Saprospiraceae bacterium]|nr:sulfatase [Saprospiraceae bacterium]
MKIYLLLFVFAIIFIHCQSERSIKHPNSPPNIIFIMTDDHSYQTLSAYDDRFIQTPNLDRIAHEGAIFRNSFVSNSICAPSRAVMLTGKHSHMNGHINNTLTFDGSQPTFPKYLQKAGYQTALIGKWHLKSLPTGFDHFEVLRGQGDYYNTPFITKDDTIPSEGYVTDVITNKSLDWLTDRDTSRPFCLLVHHKATHRVWMPPLKYLDSLENHEFDYPETLFDNYVGREAAAAQKMSIDKDMDLVYDLKMLDEEGEIKTKYREMYERGRIKNLNEEERKIWDDHFKPIIEEFKQAKRAGADLVKWKYQRYMRDYIRCLMSVDDNIGRLLDYLDQNNLSENTLVVYTSDQGFYMGEHGWFDKRFMYEESMRTPLLMRYPAIIKPKSEITELVQNIDYAPTFLDLAGVPIPNDMQGLSLVPLLKGENSLPGRDALYYHYYEFPNEHMVKRHYGIRTDRYKLIHFYNDIDDWEFYDLKEDPQEMHNLIDDSNYENTIDSLKSELEKLRIHYKDDSDDIAEIKK